MRNKLYAIVGFLAVALLGCSDPSLSHFENSQEFNRAEKKDGKFRILDSVKLEEEEFFFGNPDFNIKATNYSTALTSMENGRIWAFNKEGELSHYFDTKNTFEGQVGKILNAYDIDIIKKIAHVIYIGEDAIYQYDLTNNKLLNKIELKIPETLSPISMPLLKWNESKQLFVISTGHKDYVDDKDFYEKSKLISVFTKDGDHVSSFGSFPDYFKEVVHFNSWVRFFHSYLDDENIYLSFGRRPQIYKFDYNGQLLETFGQTSEEFDYRVEKISPEQPSFDQFSDLYYGLAKNENRNVFYYFILDMDKPIGNGLKFSYRVLRFDKDESIYMEAKVPSNYKLLPGAKGDTLYFYSIDKQYDEKYLVKTVFN
jgi:hypothetical protein